jgi:hypothetical protein
LSEAFGVRRSGAFRRSSSNTRSGC